MKIKQLEASIERQAQEEYQACQIQNNVDELENQKFITQYVACMVGIELPEEETEETDYAQNLEQSEEKSY
jgi:hypothetical protein